MTSRQASEEALAEINAWMRRTYNPAAWLWTDSGTSALTLALRIAAERTGSRRVALPAYGCYDLATACDGADSEVVLYDLDPVTLGPDWQSLQGALASGARTVVVAHLYGMPVDLVRVRRLAASAGALLVEDAAQAIGAAYGGKPCGTYGDLAVLSFGRGKGLTAGGGGALLIHDQRLIGQLSSELLPSTQDRGWRRLGAVAVQSLFARPACYAIPASLPFLRLGDTLYHPPKPPALVPKACLGVLAGSLHVFADELVRRRAVAGRLLSRLAQTGEVHVIRNGPSSDPGYLRLPACADDGAVGQFTSARAGRLGVAPGYPRSLSDLQEFLPRVRNGNETFPGARRLVNYLLTFPTHGMVTERDLVALKAISPSPLRD